MLEIQYMKTDELNPYEGNAKEHSREQVEQIAESIREFGFADPIAVWGENNTIVEGHGRLLAARKMGLDEVPVIRLDGLTDEQRRAYTLIHNQLTLNSGFNVDMLQLELESIQSIDMERFSFTLDNGAFSMDDFEEVKGYDKEKSDREYFEMSFSFPVSVRDTVAPYIRKHKNEIIERLIKEAGESELR